MSLKAPSTLRSSLGCTRFAAVILPVLLLAQTPHPQEGRRLLVICIAGLDARFLSQPAWRLKIPNIRKMMRDGAVAAGVMGVAPSDTAASDVAMMTGVPPFEEAEPLWQAAATEGLKAATVYWPTKGGGHAAFDFPSGPDAAAGRDVQFESVAGRSSPAGVIDSIEKAHPGFEKDLWDDASSARAAVWLLENRKADLVVVRLAEVESSQRETSALSIYAREALENEDDLVGQMIAAAGPGAVVALVSGHGFENENYLVRPRVLLKQSGGEANVEVKYGLMGTEEPATAARLRRLMKDGRRHGIAREVPMDEVKSKAPSLGAWVAAFDTPANFVAVAGDSGPALGPGTHHGVSGLWPDRPGYRSVLVIAGAGIHAKKLGEIDLLRIAPTLADAIGVKLPQARKSSLWPSISR